MRSKSLSWVLLFLGLGFIFAVLFAPKVFNKGPEPKNMVANLQATNGSIIVTRHVSRQKKRIKNGEKIYEFDWLETGSTGEGLLVFNNGAQVKIRPQTALTIENFADNKYNLLLRRGDIEIVSAGKTESLWIIRDGERILAENYQPALNDLVIQAELTPTPTNSPEPDSITAPTTTEKEQGEGLTNDYIATILRQQRQNFFRCYSQLLQKMPDSKGRLSISFSIEPNGKINNSQIVTTTFTDDSFHRCIIDVVSRVQFHSFSGSAISTLFPLKFE